MKSFKKTGLASLLMCTVALFTAPASIAHVETQTPISERFLELRSDAKIDDYFARFNKSLTKHRGQLSLAGGDIQLDVPAGFYFLDAADTSRLFEETIGDVATDDILGMILPNGVEPLASHGWRVMVWFDAVGHIKNEVAINADDTLNTFIAEAANANAAREALEISPIELTGWASAPTYCSDTKAFTWGIDLVDYNRNLDLVDYRVNLLGRQGVLKLELVASGFDLEAAHAFGASLAAAARFTEGARYEDFRPGQDAAAGLDVADFLKLGWAN